jgi:3',5'-cyclic AMP phosphodiesterase CpdA
MIDLRTRPDGTFTIAQFTDLHLSDGNPADQQTVALMRSVLEAERPDFAMLTGDVIAGTGKDGWDAAEALALAAKPMEERGIPWAAVFGNHDDEATHSRPQLMEVLRAFPHCVSQPGPADLPGLGHFVLDVQAPSGPVGRLYGLDSLSYGPKDVSPYAWIEEPQIRWFRAQAASADGQTGLMFFHIPVPEYQTLWDSGQAIGDKHEEVCCPKVNSGFFDALAASQKVQGVFVGHDHINDYEGTLRGVRLCYGRGGGYNCYGKEGFPHGARLIRLREGHRGFETWLRLENGQVIQRPSSLEKHSSFRR